jgi:methanogenic corrinoid protein MtbC1
MHDMRDIRNAAAVETITQHAQRLAERAARTFKGSESARTAAKDRVAIEGDFALHLEYLCHSLRAGSAALFADYADPSHKGLRGRRVRRERVRDELLATRDALRKELPDLAGPASAYLEDAARRLATAPPDVPSPYVEPAAHAESYLRCALAYDAAGALAVVRNARKQGMSLRELYLEVIQRAQLELGRLWECDQVTVAQEHYCSALAQRVLAELWVGSMHGRGDPTVVVACVAGELHELGARMVADFFELDGWDSTYLGAATPLTGVLETVRVRRATLLALSVTITSRITVVQKLIGAVRHQDDLQHVRILVGGRPFHIAPELWRTLGADRSAPDADGAVSAGRELVRFAGSA